MSTAQKHNSLNHNGATVFVVDDDAAMRGALEFLIKSAGLRVRSFDSALAFLGYYNASMGGCLLLDVRMPGMTGLELQERLQEQRLHIPVIIVTAFGDVPMAVRAMQAGAFDFIEKPFDGAVLLERVHRALALDVESREKDEYTREIDARLTTLTRRERQVMDLVVQGLLNKQVASELNISMKTVENHRARVMDKMSADSLAELVRMALAVGLAQPNTT